MNSGWTDTFYGPVRVPDEAGNGKARVTLSFPDWKEGHVMPATFEVPLAEAGERAASE